MDINSVDTFLFPGGEISVNIDNIPDNGYIFASIVSAEQIIQLLLITDAYKRKYGKTPELYLPYIPYARQDRICNSGEALSIKVFADLINAQQYPVVHVLDPHSDVSSSLINNIKITDNTVFAKRVWNDLDSEIKNSAYIVSPDAGALKKTHKIAKAVGYDKEVIFCEKQRDTKTGKITGTKVYCDDIKGKDFILFDDICDGGRTFIEIAKVLKDNDANRIILVVSHGIFSKGLDCIFKYIDEVYCTNSFENMCQKSCINSNDGKIILYDALKLMQDYDKKDLEYYIRKAV